MTSARWLDRSARRLIPALALICLAPPAHAQVVQGRLLDSSTKTAILLGRIALLDTTFAIVDQTFANEEGDFTLTAPRPGAYWVAADRTGYVPRVDGILDLGAGGRISIEYYLKPRPSTLRALEVAATPAQVQEYLASVGFTERKQAGGAYFITPEMVARGGASSVALLLRSAPGAFVRDQGGATTVLFRGGTFPAAGAAQLDTLRTVRPPDQTHGNRATDPLGYCTPRVFVNGAPADAVTAGIPGAMIDGVVGIEELVAVEVHSGPASMPIEFAGIAYDCTTLLIWTKRGSGDVD